MSRRKPKKTQAEKEYFRERNRIQKQIRRMISRGYELAVQLPEIPKKIVAGSVRRLKKITTEKLYEKAEYVDTETGEIVSGKRGRRLERERAAEKGKATRKQKKAAAAKKFEQELQEAAERDRKAREEEWHRRKQAEDEENKRRLREEEKFREQFSNAAMMKQTTEGVLDDREQDFPKTVARIREMIDTMINLEGEKEFWLRLSKEADFLTELDEVFYRPVDHIRLEAFIKIRSAILGRSMSAEEMQETSDDYEDDIAYNTDIDDVWG